MGYKYLMFVPQTVHAEPGCRVACITLHRACESTAIACLIAQQSRMNLAKNCSCKMQKNMKSREKGSMKDV